MNRGQPGYSMVDDKHQEHRISASLRCPSCGHELECTPDMAGFPAGIKFDPTDQELIEHLESKVMDGGSRAHPLIDDFIPTLHGKDGICYAFSALAAFLAAESARRLSRLAFSSFSSFSSSFCV
nr:NAC domain-containing protein 75-like [Lolium perenne]